MNTVKLITEGSSQIVHLPKEYQFRENEVIVNKVGDVVVIYPKSSGWAPLLNANGQFTEDFMSERLQ